MPQPSKISGGFQALDHLWLYLQHIHVILKHENFGNDLLVGLISDGKALLPKY